MFSEIYTGTCCLPLCTAIVRPTNSGNTVERRDQVFTGRLSLVARTASTFFIRCRSTNGPFLTERAISSYPLNLKATAHDHAASPLVATCTEALGRNTPWADRMTACRSLAFATTVRVVDRVHGHTAHCRADAAPAIRTSLADGTQRVFTVADFADGRAAIDVHLADFARAQTQLRIAAFAGQQLHCSACRTRQLRTLAGQHLDRVDSGTDRDVAQRQRIAGFDRRFRAAHQLCTGGNALGRQDVAAFAVCIHQQCQVCATVRVILQTLDRGRDIVLVALEIDETVMFLVPAAHMTGGDVAVMVTSRGSGLFLQQRRFGLALVQLR